jgi:mRNA interferase MazF
VWLVDLGLAAKVRPVLAVSVTVRDDDRALVTVVPHTTSVRGTRFETAVTASYLKAGAFDAQNVITIPHGKLIRRIGRMSPEDFARVEAALASWLGLGS